MAAAASTFLQFAVGVGAIAISLFGVLIVKKLQKEKIPKEWQQVGKVRKLYIYPLKSGKGNESATLVVTEKGFKEVEKSDKSLTLRDRSFLIYTPDSQEVRTARQLPKSVLIQIRGGDNGVFLSAPDQSEIFVRVPKIENNVRVFFGNEPFTCTDCGDEVAKWLSNYFLNKNEGLRLGYGDGTTHRNVVQVHKKLAEYYSEIDNDLQGIYSDLAALLLVNQATVEDLNEHMPEDQQITCKNFRPNILIEGVEAFAEDAWRYVKIGDVVAKVCLECLRCIETTVSPTEGVLNMDRQPLKTLLQYRKSNGPFKDAVMGVYLKVLNTGKISEGDPIYVPKSL